MLAQQGVGDEWDAFPPGTRVRGIRLEGYDAVVAAKVRDRIGAVSSLRSSSGKPVVVFQAIGKHASYRWVPEQPEHLHVVAGPAP